MKKISKKREEKLKEAFKQNPDILGELLVDLQKTIHEENIKKTGSKKEKESPMRTLMRSTAPDLTDDELDELENIS